MAMSTVAEHSDLQLLQDRHISMLSRMASSAKPPGKISPLMASNSMWTRPRVEKASSRVALNEGHMAPTSSRRHLPMPTQREKAPPMPPSELKSNIVGI